MFIFQKETIMAYTNKVAITEGQEIFVVAETTPGTLVFPAAADLVVATGDGSLNQNPTFTDSEEIANTRSVLDSFRDITPAGTWEIPTYIRPSGAAGDVPSTAAILEALFGDETIVGGTSVTYGCAMSLGTVSIWVKKKHSGVDEGTVFFASGATVDQLSLGVTSKGAVKGDFSGGFMQLGWCGTDQLNGALSGAETDIVVNDAKKSCVGGRIKIGIDDNSGAGYAITAVNVSTETLTISPANAGAQDDDTTVAPFLPTGTKTGTPAENRNATLSVGGSEINFKNLDLTFTNAIEYLTEEITTSEYPEDYAEGKRNVDGSIDIYLRHDDLQYFYDAMQNTDKAIILTVSGGAGYIMALTMGQCRLSVPVVSSTAPTVSLNIPYKAKASTGEDEIEMAFT
jgi:hypothetical protein